MSNSLSAEDEASYFPDDDIARHITETIYKSAHRFLTTHQAAEDPQIESRIVDPAIAEAVKHRLFDCNFTHIYYERVKFHLEDDSRAMAARSALIELKKIKAAIAALPPALIEGFLKDRRKRDTIFSPSVQGSLARFDEYCTAQIGRIAPARGRKPDDVFQTLTSDVVEIFEFWIGRAFKLNFSLARGRSGAEEEFVGTDAACVYIILKGLMPDITVTRTRTALRSLPPREAQYRNR